TVSIINRHCVPGQPCPVAVSRCSLLCFFWSCRLLPHLLKSDVSCPQLLLHHSQLQHPVVLPWTWHVSPPRIQDGCWNMPPPRSGMGARSQTHFSGKLLQPPCVLTPP